MYRLVDSEICRECDTQCRDVDNISEMDVYKNIVTGVTYTYMQNPIESCFLMARVELIKKHSCGDCKYYNVKACWNDVEKIKDDNSCFEKRK